jgi:hypothetical protein
MTTLGPSEGVEGLIWRLSPSSELRFRVTMRFIIKMETQYTPSGRILIKIEEKAEVER